MCKMCGLVRHYGLRWVHMLFYHATWCLMSCNWLLQACTPITEQSRTRHRWSPISLRCLHGYETRPGRWSSSTRRSLPSLIIRHLITLDWVARQSIMCTHILKSTPHIVINAILMLELVMRRRILVVAWRWGILRCHGLGVREMMSLIEVTWRFRGKEIILVAKVVKSTGTISWFWWIRRLRIISTSFDLLLWGRLGLILHFLPLFFVVLAQLLQSTVSLGIHVGGGPFSAIGALDRSSVQRLLYLALKWPDRLSCRHSW